MSGSQSGRHTRWGFIHLQRMKLHFQQIHEIRNHHINSHKLESGRQTEEERPFGEEESGRGDGGHQRLITLSYWEKIIFDYFIEIFKVSSCNILQIEKQNTTQHRENQFSKDFLINVKQSLMLCVKPPLALGEI